MFDDLYGLVSLAKRGDILSLLSLRVVVEETITKETGIDQDLSSISDTSIIELFENVLASRAISN